MGKFVYIDDKGQQFADEAEAKQFALFEELVREFVEPDVTQLVKADRDSLEWWVDSARALGFVDDAYELWCHRRAYNHLSGLLREAMGLSVPDDC